MKPADAAAVLLALTETGGEITPEIRQELDSIDLAGWNKADDLVALIRECEGEQSRAKAQAAIINAQAGNAGRRADALKAYLLERMKAAGLEHVNGARFTVRLQASPVSIRWIGEGDVPGAFARVKIELDSAKAKAAYQDGRLPAGFEATHGRHLVIKG